MPFIIDGFDFNPLESRSGLLLNGYKNKDNTDAQENIKILENAFNASIDFIQCILEQNEKLQQRHLFARSKMPKPIVNFDDDTKEWFKNKQKFLREKLKNFKIVKNGGYYDLKDLLLPIFNVKNNDVFYKIVSNLNIRNKILPESEEYLNWYNVIIEENNEIQGLKIKDNPLIKSWGITKNEETGEDEINYIYDENQLLNDLKNCKDINTLSQKIQIEKKRKVNKSEIIQYLNEFILFLKNNCKYEQILNEYPIIPNRNGNFKKIEELYSDHTNIIPKVIMDIYDSISEKKLNDELIDQEVNVDYLGDILKKKDFDFISSYLNSYIIKKEDIEKAKKYVVYPLLSIKTDKADISQIYEFLILFYELKQTEILTDENIKIPFDLWTSALKFWYEEHPKEIEQYGNIKGLKNKVRDKSMNENILLKWMNSYLNFLKLNSTDRNFENLNIFPNQNGDFCVLNELHFDCGFPEEFKDILKKYFNIDKREILLDKEIISYNSHNIMPEINIVDDIVNEFKKIKNEESNKEKAKSIALEILCLYPNNKEKETIRKYIDRIIFPPGRTPQQIEQNPFDYLGFAEIIYNKKDNFNLIYIETEHLDYLTFINFIIEQICDEISKYESFENIKNIFYGIKTQNDFEEFLIKIIKFIWDNQNSEQPITSCIDCNTSQKKIFLNKKNELMSIEYIRIKEHFNISLEDEKVLLDICSNNHINKDYRKELMNEKLNEKLLDYKNKFKSYTLENVCTQIDQSIMKYDQKNANSNKVYDNDFYQLIQNLKKLKFEEKFMEDHFPYYWKNRVKMCINCFEEKSIEKLLNNCDINNIESNIQLLELFKEKKYTEIFFKYLNECGGDIFKLLTHFNEGYGLEPLVKLKTNLLFSFKTKLVDFNQKQITIETGPLIYSPEDIIQFGNVIIFSKNIEFEVNQTINDLNDNKEITINLIEKK